MAEGRLWGGVEAGMGGCQAGKGPFWTWATGCDGGGGHPPPSLLLSRLLPLGLQGQSASAPGRLGGWCDSERSPRVMTWVVSEGPEGV